MNVSIIFFAIFVFFLAVFLYIKRKNLSLQNIIYPIFYIILYRTKAGINFIEKWSSRHRELFKFLGLVCIGLGFFYMLVAAYNIVASYFLLIKYMFKPMFPILVPGMNIPGEGTVTFLTWIVAIFVIATVHELAHGLVSAANRVKIKSTGFGFLSFIVPIFPAFFVEPDENVLRKQNDTVQYSIFSAGPMANLLVYFMLLILILYALTPLRAAYSEPAGVSMEAINQDYPAGKLFSGRFVVTKVDNATVNTTEDFAKSVSGITPGQSILFQLQNGTSYNIVAAKDPDNTEQGYIGVFGFKDEVKWHNTVGPFIGWLLSLLRVVALLNLIVGFVNLLPMFVTDGARMVEVLFSKIFGKASAKRLWFTVNIATVLLVAGTVILPYLLKWFK